MCFLWSIITTLVNWRGCKYPNTTARKSGALNLRGLETQTLWLLEPIGVWCAILQLLIDVLDKGEMVKYGGFTGAGSNAAENVNEICVKGFVINTFVLCQQRRQIFKSLMRSKRVYLEQNTSTSVSQWMIQAIALNGYGRLVLSGDRVIPEFSFSRNQSSCS
jgi:hypothetical protein